MQELQCLRHLDWQTIQKCISNRPFSRTTSSPQSHFVSIQKDNEKKYNFQLHAEYNNLSIWNTAYPQFP